MRYLFILLLSPMLSFGQNNRLLSVNPAWHPVLIDEKGVEKDGWSNVRTVTTYDTTIIYKGIDTVEHDHILMLNDAEFICKICLYNFSVKQTDTVINDFEEARKRVAKILKMPYKAKPLRYFSSGSIGIGYDPLPFGSMSTPYGSR